ncbi:hypothetical protein CHC121_12420 [Helicobacter pylori]
MLATRKESKRVSTLAQPPSKDAPMNTLFLMVFILYPFILEFFNNLNILNYLSRIVRIIIK